MNAQQKRRLPRATLAIPVVAALVVALLTGVGSRGDEDAPPALAPAASKVAQRSGTVNTSFMLGTLNLLGAGHTDGKNPRKGYAKSNVRLVAARQVLDAQGIDVVGLQEMHASQAHGWVANNRGEFGTYPGTSLRISDAQRSIAWRLSKFTLVQAHTLDVPYFGGRIEKMPYVLLQSKATGQLFWVYNAHNPANVEGPALKYRQQGWDRLITLVRQLRTSYPGVPVFATGDMNDRANFFCRVVGNSELVAANGGSATPTSCTPPPAMQIDWLTGTSPNTFTDYAVVRDALVKKATDHPLVKARVNIPGGPMSASPAKRAVVVTVEGLRGYTVNSMLKKKQLPTMARMQTQGASALNARTATESTMGLPNLVSTVTGRRIARGAGGHGVSSQKYRGTVHKAAGGYVTSVFDMVANTGGSTSLYASDASASVLATSWNAKNSRPRVTGGPATTKVGRYAVLRTDKDVVKRFVSTAKNPTTYTHLHLTEPQKVGRKYGFTSKQYTAAVRKVDRQLRTIRSGIAESPALLGSTILVVVGTNGGYAKQPWVVTRPANYTVPILVTGAGVAPEGNLYRLNPARRSPGNKRVAWTAGAITTADTANLVLAALKLPALPGSTQNTDQLLTVLKPTS